MTGRPFTVFASDASLNMPGNAQTADQIEQDVEIFGKIGDAGTYFDTSAFARVTDVRFGNSGRNILRGPGVVNLDMGLFRTFKLTQQFEMQFRAEAFNVTNTPHFGQPERKRQQLELREDSRSHRATMPWGASRQFRFGLRVTF